MRRGTLGLALAIGAAGAGVAAARRARAEARALRDERDAIAEELDETLRESREALTANELSFRSLVTHIPGAIYRCAYDDDWTAYYLSDAIEAISGYPASEFLGSSVRSLIGIVHPDDVAAIRAAVDQAVAERRPYVLDYRVLHADGTIHWVNEKGQAILSEDGEVDWLDGAIFDVTEQRVLQERLGQSARLEAVGRLAGGIAHDFNNLLTAITGYAQLLLDRLDDGTPCHRDAREIDRAATRASELTGQLLAFGRGQSFQPKVLDVNALVRDLSDMLRRLIGEDVALALDLPTEVAPVKADPGQLEQVIVNLVVNARDAMPDGGVVTVSTADVHDRELGPLVSITVTDTGVGMSPETLAHAFEPFFTTKETGRGTGLGLATVYGIVTQSGGHVRVESEPGIGSIFTVLLPRASAPVPEADRPIDRRERARPGTETILLVEDEDVVRDLAGRVLREHGYTVLEARDGGDALTVAATHDDGIDLMLTDVVMPQLGGRELAELLAPARPGLKVLFMSGYTDDLQVLQRTPGNGEDFLPKPFTPELLARTVRAVLDGRTLSRG
ncbi:MAG: ATP-binding protein [Thermoleophilia bacterium]